MTSSTVFPLQPDPVSAYLELATQRQDLFTQSSCIPLILDETQIRTFAKETGKAMGLVFDNRPYYMVLADLCSNGTKYYRYARVVYPESGTNGSVALPHRDGKFGLLQIFRHAPRCLCWEIPRGFAQKGITPEENIKRELSEEIGATVSEVRFLGHIQADTGLSSGRVQVFLAEVEEASAQIGYEGIEMFSWVSENELWQMIASGKIQDSFTLSALMLYFTQTSHP